jgi:hypothetical protein
MSPRALCNVDQPVLRDVRERLALGHEVETGGMLALQFLPGGIRRFLRVQDNGLVRG